MFSTREIDKKAQDIFNDTLPPSWLVRSQNPDIHIDYYVEIGERSKTSNVIPSGVVFGVQLKGTNSPRYSKSLIKISFKTKHLSYYLDKVKQPVFIIVVDIGNRQSFWLFAQEWAKKKLKDHNWKKQNTIEIKIPIENCLLNMDSFQSAVFKAETFMHDLWPSSIPAAIEYAKTSLEELDSRVQVDVSHERGETRFTLQARESFDLNICFKENTQVQSKFADLLNTGKTAMFDLDEIVDVIGSPLFQSIFEKEKNGKLVFRPGNKINTSIVLSAIDMNNQEKAVLYGIEGMMWTATKIAQFQGGIKESPLFLELSFPIPPSSENNPLTVNFKFESSAWSNIPVLILPHFDKLKDFFSALRKGYLMRIICEIKGNHIFTAISQPNLDPQFMEASNLHLQIVEKLRNIARKINIDPLYPKEGQITKGEFETILLLHDLLNSGEYRQRGTGVTFNARLLPNKNFFKIMKNSDRKNFADPLVIEPKDMKFILFRKEYEFFPIRYTLTNAVLLTDLSKINEDAINIHTEEVEVQWSGGEKSELIISRI